MANIQPYSPTLQRRQLLEVMEDSQLKAWRKLRDAGVPEAQVLAVIPRIRECCLFALNEYDQAYLAVEELTEKDGRSAAHQRFFNDKAAYILHQMEAGIAEIVTIAIRRAIYNIEHPAQAQPVITPVRSKAAPSAWQTFLKITFMLLLWLLGSTASYLLALSFTASDTLALLGPGVLFVLWLFVRFSWWGLLFPLSPLGLAFLLFLL